MDCRAAQLGARPHADARTYNPAYNAQRQLPRECAAVRYGTSRLDVLSLQWPASYRASAAPVLARTSALRERYAWQGADVNGPLFSGRRTAYVDGEVDARRTLFRRVARQVAARSFNGKELILACTDRAGMHIAVNLAANLASVHLHHLLLLGADQDTCPALRRSDPPFCVWSSLLRRHWMRLKQYGVTKIRLLWLQRYYYVAALISLGINVLLLDTDVVLFSDPYRHFKGVFANVSLLALNDKSAQPPTAVNGGTLYIQNAAANGPVARIFQEFVRRTLPLLNNSRVPLYRYNEKRCPPPAFFGEVADRLLFDQYVINNAMLTVRVGAQVTMESCAGLDSPRRLWAARSHAELRVGGPLWEWAPSALRVPREVPTAPPAYPSRFWLRQRVLTADGLNETIAKAPSWLFASESDDASALHWGAHPSPAVLVHFVCSAWPGSGGRLTAMALWGKWFAADVARHCMHAPKPPSSESLRARAAQRNWSRALTTAFLPALVAFRHVLHVSSRQEYQLWVTLLHGVALLTGRRPVLPLAACARHGEWAEASRCVWVMHATVPQRTRLCVMRPPSNCWQRIALPSDLARVRAADVAVARLPWLGLRDDGDVDVAGMERALGSDDARRARLLLLDLDDLASAEQLSNLLIGPRGSLCELDQRGCQSTCGR